MTSQLEKTGLPARTESTSAAARVPIVGIGADAGGLAALQYLFAHLSEQTGMALIIVLRGSGGGKQSLATRLQTFTALPVVVIEDNLAVEPDHIYVAPPRRYVTLANNRLQLNEQQPLHERHTPINFFFATLANARGSEAIGILLSGKGSDGLEGLKAIQAQGGLTLVQSPQEALYPALPRQASELELANEVCTASELAQKLNERAQGVTLAKAATAEDETTFLGRNDEVLNAILTQLHIQTGYDLSYYKRSTLLRRIARRSQIHSLVTLADYHTYLRQHPEEVQALFKDCLISVTSFFRDPEEFNQMEKEVIPQLVATKTRNDTVRVWVSGCATGEEAYSLAILFYERFVQLEETPRLQIFATDIDEEAITTARRGLYPKTIAQDVSPTRLQRFFTEETEGYRVKLELRESVLFAVHNLLKDPPFSKVDLISCRNLLIYFNRDVQEKALALFHYALNRNGYLFLGTAESIDSVDELFSLLDKRHHIFQRRQGIATQRSSAPPLFDGGVKMLGPVIRQAKPQAPSIEELYQQWTLRRYAPPRVLVNENYEVTHLFNGADRYLREREGAVTQNILQKVLPELRLDLRTALYHAVNKGERTDSRLLRVLVNHEYCLIQLHVGPVQPPGFPKGYYEVVFEERQEPAVVGLPQSVSPVDVENTLTSRLEEELLRTRERLQMVIEEHETSNQDLKVANEELQSINEELKSTTEELETSKEELQSMNEELSTINHELKLKIDELSRANSDLFNLIVSTDVGALFLDLGMRIKRFTPRVTELFHIIDSDIGRPITHIAHRIRPGTSPVRLLELAARVLSTLEQSEELIQSEEERWYIMRMFPYRTVENTVDGIVITFLDITALKRAEHEIKQRIQQQTVAELGRQALQGDDPLTLMTTAMARATAVLGVEFAKVLEMQADGETLRFKIGLGWSEWATTETTSLTTDNSQSWYTFHEDQPIVVEDIREEKRFQLSPLLSAHNVASGVTVVIPGRATLYGVFGIFSQRPRPFTRYEVDFLQAIANVLGEAIERKRTEMELAQERARLEAVLQYMPAGVMIAEAPSGKLSLSNAQVDRIWRHPYLPASTIDEYRVYKGFHPDGRPYAPDEWPLARAITTGEIVHNEEIEFLGGDGVRGVMAVSAAPIRDDAGQITTGVVIFDDITARKQAEEVLRQQAHMLDSTHDAIFMWDLDGAIVYWNQGAERLYGYTKAEVLGQVTHTLLQTAHPQPLPTFEAILRHEKEWSGELEHITKDGRKLTVLSRHQLLREPDGKQYILETSIDITDRKQTEEALRASAANFRAAIEHASDAIFIATDNRIYVEVNAAACALSGYSREELIGKHVEDLTPPTAYPRLDEDRRQLLAGRSQVGEWGLLRKDGSIVPIEVSAKQLPDGRWQAIVRDITERKQIEARQRFLADLGETMVHVQAPDELLKTVGEALGEFLGASRCYFVEVVEDQLNIRLDYHRGVPSLTGSYPLTRFEPDNIAAYQAGRTLVSPDLQSDPPPAALYNELYAQLGFRARVGVPLLRSGQWAAGLVVNHHEPRGWTEAEVNLIQTVAERTWLAVENRRLLQQTSELLAQLSAILDNAPVGMSLYDADTRYVRINPALARINGQPVAAHLGKSIRELWPQQAELAENRIAQVFATGRGIYHQEISNPAGNYFLASWYPITINGAVRYVGASVLDITERKQAEETIREQLNEIEAIYAATPVGLCMVDTALRYVRINAALAQLNGHPPAFFSGRTLRETGTEASAALVEPLYRQVLATGEPILNHEIHGATAAEPARPRDWLVSYYPLKNDEDQVIGVNAVVVEITERKQNERELKTLNDTLEQRVRERTAELERRTQELIHRNRELDQFAYVASHDLRSPLRAIEHLSNWIAQDVGDSLPPASQEHLTKLRGRVKRLERLLDDLLAYSRADRYQYPVEQVDTNALVEDIVRMLAPPEGFAVAMPTAMPVLLTERVPLELVLRNLINNAIKHHHRSDGRIAVTATEVGDFIEFAITDNGPGIAAEFHERIFQMFQTLKPRDTVEGSGMGLAIVKKVVESRGGKITVESDTGQGATFRFTWLKTM